MACCGGGEKKDSPQDLKAKQESKAVDKAISQQVQRDLMVNKLLLLGAGYKIHIFLFDIYVWLLFMLVFWR